MRGGQKVGPVRGGQRVQAVRGQRVQAVRRQRVQAVRGGQRVQ